MRNWLRRVLMRRRHEDDLPGLDRQIEAERARQHAELRVALHRVRTLLATEEGR